MQHGKIEVHLSHLNERPKRDKERPPPARNTQLDSARIHIGQRSTIKMEASGGAAPVSRNMYLEHHKGGRAARANALERLHRKDDTKIPTDAAKQENTRAQFTTVTISCKWLASTTVPRTTMQDAAEAAIRRMQAQ